MGKSTGMGTDRNWFKNQHRKWYRYRNWDWHKRWDWARLGNWNRLHEWNWDRLRL